jgi:soluble lytic murein transglycosylase-like protein
MAPLKLAVSAVAMFASSSAGASSMERWRPLIAEAAERFSVPEAIIASVIRAESGGMTTLNGRPITSRAGAMGLMQLMPATWKTMRIALRLGADPYDPHDNLLAGTFYLRQLRDRFGYPGMIAAYNAGPARYAAYLAGRSRLPGETVAYLNSVTGVTQSAAITSNTEPRQLLFALRHDLVEALPAQADRPVESGLFAVRKGVP